MRYREGKYGGTALRCVGLLLLGLATIIGHHLFAAADPAAKDRLSAYLLALVGVISATAGAGMALLGRHLRDQVELSARWTIHIADRNRSARPGAPDLCHSGWAKITRSSITSRLRR